VAATSEKRPEAGPERVHGAVELRDLRYFVVVAEELHFGRAAARLYITQPGLSQAIARLEQGLDVALLRRTRRHVELTEAGMELLRRARRLLADHADAVTWVRKVGRGEAGVVRLGVALLTEPAVAGALVAFRQRHESIVLDRSGMVSERLLVQLAEGRLDAAIVHQVPALSLAEGLEWEPIQRGRLALLVAASSPLTQSQSVPLRALRGKTFLVNPRVFAPGAFEGLKLMCREFGGFDVSVLESPVASTLALDGDWRLIEDGTAIAAVPEVTGRAICPEGVAVVPVQPPPQYVLAVAWRSDEGGAAVHRFLAHVRAFRDQHGWLAQGDPTGRSGGDPLAWLRTHRQDDAQRLLPL
jgi:DNA-binding transcriptional LysR family regulator